VVVVTGIGTAPPDPARVVAVCPLVTVLAAVVAVPTTAAVVVVKPSSELLVVEASSAAKSLHATQAGKRHIMVAATASPDAKLLHFPARLLPATVAPPPDARCTCMSPIISRQCAPSSAIDFSHG